MKFHTFKRTKFLPRHDFLHMAGNPSLFILPVDTKGK